MGRCPAHLAPVGEDGDRRAVHVGADGRRQTLGVEQPLDVVPVQQEADQAPGRPARGDLGLEGTAADVVALLEADELAQADLEVEG